MKRLMMMIVFSILTSAATVGLAQAQTVAPSHEAETPEALHKQFTTELRKLRLELLQQGVEFQEWKIKQLERELQQAARERQRIEEERGAIQQELAGPGEYAGGSTPPEAEQLQGLEAIKAELKQDLEELRTAQHTIAQREAGLTGQLNQEQERLQELLRKVEKLKN